MLRINKASNIAANGAISSSIYLSENPDTDSILSTEEWVTLEVVFTVTEEMSEEFSAQSICLVFIVYTNNDTNGLTSSENHILIDDLEINKVKITDQNHQHEYTWEDEKEATYESEGLKAHYYCEACETYFDEDKNEIDYNNLIIEKIYINLQEGYGTDFDGFNPVDHADLFKPVGGTVEKGWKTDSNGIKAFGIQGGYQAVALQSDPSDSTNTVLRVQGGKEVTRVALNVNQEIINPGTYKASIKVRLGTENATDIGQILLRINELNDIAASGAISSSIYFSESSDTDSKLSASEWTTLEVVFTVTEEMSAKFSQQDVCLVFVVYTNNNTNGLTSAVNHILIDDLEIYKL